MQTDYIAIFVGFGAIAIGILGNKFHYTQGFNVGKPAPTWLGRTIFISGGTVTLLFGFAKLFGFIPEHH